MAQFDPQRKPTLHRSSSGPAAPPDHSALTLWTVQTVDILPSPADDATAAPFMNHNAVLPLLSRQRRSLLPSPLKSPVSTIDQAVDTLPRPTADATVAPFMSHIAVVPLVSRQS